MFRLFLYYEAVNKIRLTHCTKHDIGPAPFLVKETIKRKIVGVYIIELADI
jgi:hypothetical protein